MEINSDKISTEMETLIYEQPSLKKYGTMKELTLGAGGSSSDLVAQACTTSCTVAGKNSDSKYIRLNESNVSGTASGIDQGNTNSANDFSRILSPNRNSD